jgi:hypothetical protein
MTRWRLTGSVLAFCAVTLVVLALAPLVLLGGELISRHILRQRRLGTGGAVLVWVVRGRGARSRAGPALIRRLPGRIRMPRSEVRVERTGGLAFRFITNPVWIALTAPARWLSGLFRARAGHGRGRRGPPPAGVREPRRPRPDQPADVMALPEPRDAE